VVVTADHGESWGERLPPGQVPRDVFDLHGNHLHDEVVRIPWILHAPGRLPPARVRGTARGVDMLPTLLDLLGLPPVGCDGRSLLPHVSEGSLPEGRRAHFCRNRDFVDQPTLPTRPGDVFVELGCVSGATKVLRRVGEEAMRVYDLRVDPTEDRPRVEAHHPLAAELDAAWAACVVGAHDEADHRAMRRRLRALGYL